MPLFACIVSFMLGWIAHKVADIYDKRREKEYLNELENGIYHDMEIQFGG